MNANQVLEGNRLYVRADGTRIATTFPNGMLPMMLTNPISDDAAKVWTGMDVNGKAALFNCSNCTSDLEVATEAAGTASSTLARAVSGYLEISCREAAHFYCVEQ